MATLFLKVRHHCKSARMSKLSRMWGWPRASLGVCSSSIIRLRNALPSLTTRQACRSVPIKDSNCCFQQVLRHDHWESEAFRRINLSAGKRSTPDCISISILRNVRQCVGPSSLSSASGTPISAQVTRIWSKFCLHISEPGGLIVMKSLR